MSHRDTMVATIEAEARETAYMTGRSTLDPRVLAAMRRVRRELFVPEAGPESAYENRPHPIGHGQTISQPFIVALMTDLLELTKDSRVLEIGTGSGYQTAILAELVEQVWSVEVIDALSRRAAQALAAEGFNNVCLRVGDGSAGWPEAAPFDAVIVTAAAPEIPQPLLTQLGAPGRMVIPLGLPWANQALWLIERDSVGTETRRKVLPVAFVPLVGAGIDRTGPGRATHQ